MLWATFFKFKIFVQELTEQNRAISSWQNRGMKSYQHIIMSNQTIPVGFTYVNIAACDNKYINLTNTEIRQQKPTVSIRICMSIYMYMFYSIKKKYQVYLLCFNHVQGEYEKKIKHMQTSFLHLIELHWNSSVKGAYHIRMLPCVKFPENNNTSFSTTECNSSW